MYNFPENPITTNAVTIDFLKENGALYWREIDGVVYAVYDTIFNGRLCSDVTFSGYEDFYCYSSVAETVKSLDDFAEKKAKSSDENIEPYGWHRHFSTSRRRPNGDHTQEYKAA